jgi:hypothetical protein
VPSVIVIAMWVRHCLAENVEQLFAYFPILRQRLRQPAATLAGGTQQTLAIARAHLRMRGGRYSPGPIPRRREVCRGRDRARQSFARSPP